MQNWSRKELMDAVMAYKHIQSENRRGVRIVKSQIYLALSKKYNRTRKAFEYRMQNISYVLSLSGREWIQGLKPAKHVGTFVIQEIEDVLSEIEQREVDPYIDQRVRFITAAKRKSIVKPNGSAHPKRTVTQTSGFERDAKVVAWILNNAHGRCELCRKRAPFSDVEGLPYLEVHHVRHLADGGSDSIVNAVALCPNCHREVHYGNSANEKRRVMYKIVSRLVFE